ncbi:hypothetical protein KDW_27350 [Dictyobacter vulcani]|uniref:Uncharacterized protein n=1 Tax=Dictyobacter vulcani TaxID=2607529 RepID=A0A5J4KLB2_9CHLR|nr:hypothetical protein [Dictyobacter vulcani]GER88573.1 hypothetical protein KDW_27350 [Dictyobacter vulcani]
MKSQHTRKIALKRADDVPVRPLVSRTPAKPLVSRPPARPRPSQVPLITPTRIQSIIHETSYRYGLEIVLGRLQRCFASRIAATDIEVLEFSLRQLFEQAYLLFGQLLPELTLCTNPPLDQTDPAYFYRMNTLLQDIESLLERLLPLLQLQLISAGTVLEALDRSCSLYGAAQIKKQLPQQGEDEERTVVLAAIEAALIPDSTYYQWMQALHVITGKLQNWQQQQESVSFSALFADLPLLDPTLSSIDSTLPLMLECIQTIFSTILPEFHAVSRGDDETATIHLLNLMQYSDLLLNHVDSLRQALQVVSSHYRQTDTLY